MTARHRRSLIAALLVALGAALAAAPAPAATPVKRAVAYLERAQNADGGFGAAPGASSGAAITAWATFGLAASGQPPAEVRRDGGPSLADAVAVAATGAALGSTGDVERTILALHAAGRAIPDALLAALLERRRPDGSFDGQATLSAFAVLALRAARRPVTDPHVRAATRFVAAQQNRDGGFNFGSRGGPSGIDDTAAAVQGLVAGGTAARSRAIRRAMTFLVRRQRPDGGFPLMPGAASNAQSTAWAVQALAAAGRDPRRVRRRGSRSPLAYLRSLQASDGSVRYSRTSRQTPVWVTAQALAALARAPLPIAPP